MPLQRSKSRTSKEAILKDFDEFDFFWLSPKVMAKKKLIVGWGDMGEERKKEGQEAKSRHREVVIGNCFWQLFVQAPDFFRLYANPASPHWKTGQVPLMSNLFQRSRVWAWQFTERLEELVITSVTGQLMHITLRHSWRWLSAPQ